MRRVGLRPGARVHFFLLSPVPASPIKPAMMIMKREDQDHSMTVYEAWLRDTMTNDDKNQLRPERRNKASRGDPIFVVALCHSSTFDFVPRHSNHVCVATLGYADEAAGERYHDGPTTSARNTIMMLTTPRSWLRLSLSTSSA